MRLIDGDPLYERACDLEAQAMSYVGKIGNDEAMKETWRIWSAILTERTAFKHDIFDAPTITDERRIGKWIYHPDREADYECSLCGMGSEVNHNYCPRCGAIMKG